MSELEMQILKQRLSSLEKAAERLYASSLPDPEHPHRVWVFTEALEELRRALYDG